MCKLVKEDCLVLKSTLKQPNLDSVKYPTSISNNINSILNFLLIKEELKTAVRDSRKNQYFCAIQKTIEKQNEDILFVVKRVHKNR